LVKIEDGEAFNLSQILEALPVAHREWLPEHLLISSEWELFLNFMSLGKRVYEYDFK